MAFVQVKILPVTSPKFRSLGVKGPKTADLYMELTYKNKETGKLDKVVFSLPYAKNRFKNEPQRFDREQIQRENYFSQQVTILHGSSLPLHTNTSVHISTTDGDFCFTLFPNGDISIDKGVANLDLTLETEANATINGQVEFNTLSLNARNVTIENPLAAKEATLTALDRIDNLSTMTTTHTILNAQEINTANISSESVNIKAHENFNNTGLFCLQKVSNLSKLAILLMRNMPL